MSKIHSPIDSEIDELIKSSAQRFSTPSSASYLTFFTASSVAKYLEDDF